MKILITLSLAAAILLLHSGCQPSVKSNHYDLRWLTGTWADTAADYYEEWKIKGNKYTGKGYTVAGEDTLFEEYLFISGTDSWTYYAQTEGQNKGQQIPFRLVNYDPDSLVFENRNHDFPNLIIYSKRSDSTLHVIVTNSAGDRSFSLDMKKIAP